MSSNGSKIIWEGEVFDIDPVKTNSVYDVTGAGDCYAAGFLYGYTHGYDAIESGNLASACATEVIKYLGGRPMTDLKQVKDSVLNKAA